ncbi:MAG: hypothetical protein DME99_00210 [Verrucomicrobia bacterium]|nr:MAG: hypothetical protein DME99_00210 [Verrucomicrobiota bacterium]
MQQVTVRVPASTSNLGPGLDCLGIALRLYNDVTVTRGAKSRPQAIASEAADLFFRHARCAPFSFSVSITGNVPQSRGLGSSVTARVGIFYALNALSGNRLDRLSIFQLCAADSLWRRVARASRLRGASATLALPFSASKFRSGYISSS